MAEEKSPKHVPERRCVSCGQHFPKDRMIRVLRTPAGTPVIDETGRGDGRGAYLCGSKACLLSAKKSRRLERALSVRLPEELYGRLEELCGDNTEQ